MAADIVGELGRGSVKNTVLLSFVYLTTLSASRLCSNGDAMINECAAGGGMRIGRGKLHYTEKIFLSAILSTTNPTLPDLASNIRLTIRGNGNSISLTLE
jgi:hypothetical protein